MGPGWKRLLERYRRPLRYLIVGGCTTAVNYALYFVLNWAGVYYLGSNTLAWCGAVAFAYFANGRWVYDAAGRRSLREAGAFVCSRLFSLGLETLLLFLLVDLGHMGENVAKILAAVVVVVVNYWTGRWVYRRGAR